MTQRPRTLLQQLHSGFRDRIVLKQSLAHRAPPLRAVVVVDAPQMQEVPPPLHCEASLLLQGCALPGSRPKNFWLQEMDQ
jgi:hypothetical protein